MSAKGTEARVCEDIAARQQRGLDKYGTTVEGNPLPLLQWMQHAYEEALDLAIYLKRSMEVLQGVPDEHPNGVVPKKPDISSIVGTSRHVERTPSGEWKEKAKPPYVEVGREEATVVFQYPETPSIQTTTGQPVPDPEGWIEGVFGKMPNLPVGSEVEVKWKGGPTCTENAARIYWPHVQAYRLHKPEPQWPFLSEGPDHSEAKALWKDGMEYRVLDEKGYQSTWAYGTPIWNPLLQYEIRPET